MVWNRVFLRSCVHIRRVSVRYLSFSYSPTMKLYSDKGNPFLLRILAAKNLADVPLDVEYIRYEDKGKINCPGNPKLPVLEIDNGHFLFSPNAICSYFLDQKSSTSRQAKSAENSATIDHWVEWESTCLWPVLKPLLLATLGHGKTDSQHGQQLVSILDQINMVLQSQENLSGASTGLADVVVWGSLFPLISSRPQLIGPQFGSLTKWNSNMMSQTAFSKSVEETMEGKGPQVFKNSLLAQSGVSFIHVVTEKEAKQGKPDKSAKQPANVPTDKENGTSDEASGGITITRMQASPDEIDEAVNAWKLGTAKLPTTRKPVHPILPKEGEKNILITSALPYVNNVPHLGNIIGCVLSADIFSRYCRIRGLNTLYICGTDEYGTATETKALEEGLTPKEICDKYFKLHSDVYSWFNIHFDYFGRTTTSQQTQIAQDIFWKLHKQDCLVEEIVEQLQCLGCKRFLADRFVEGTCPYCNFADARGDQCDACGKLINAVELKSPRCKVCGDKPEVKKSKHLFLDLAKLEPSLKTWVEKSSTEGTWTLNARQITRSWIQEGLRPRCITRDLKWGTPVPLEGYTDKVFYVWFDAPIGYLSITANYTEKWEKWWKNPEQVSLYQFMAKDNVPFHTVVFPSTLLGTNDNYTLLNNISATEYLNYEDDKFSKSRGVGVFGDNAADSGIPADIWRFYLLYIRPEGQDSAFSWSDFVVRNNSELLNNLGNFINRALMFLHNSFGGVVPELELNDEDKNFLAIVNRELKAYNDNLEKIRLREGLRIVLNISKYGNQYVQANKPWVLVKGSDSERSRAGTVIGLATNLSFLLSVLVQPYMPTTSEEIQTQLNVTQDAVLADRFVPFLNPGHKIGMPKPLFQKIDSSVADKLRAKFVGKKKVSPKKPAAVPASSPVPAPATASDVASLQAEITTQGEKVRSLKTNKAEKAVIDAEVATLLQLKKKLATAQGKDPNEIGSAKSRKKGKKQ